MRYYKLRRGCCVEINITLCPEHLQVRLHEGWKLSQDNGADNQPCSDCLTPGEHADN